MRVENRGRCDRTLPVIDRDAEMSGDGRVILILTDEETESVYYSLEKRAKDNRERKERWLKIAQDRELHGNAIAADAYRRMAASSERDEIEIMALAAKISALQDVTKPYAWIIDEDRTDLPWTEAGRIGPRGAAKAAVEVLQKGSGHRFRLLDGDGEISFEGRIVMCKADDKPGYQPLVAFRWCASIQYLDKNQAWVTL